MDLYPRIADHLQIPVPKVKSTVELLASDNTIPFIARYRKEMTGNLDEEQIRQINDEWERLKSLETRRESILNSVREQGKLTSELEHTFLAASSLTELEDLYQPYRPKRRTRAMDAREKGLEPLANLILEQTIIAKPLSDLIAPFLTNEVPTQEDALSGAEDIVAEVISEDAAVRRLTREKGYKSGKLTSQVIKDSDDPRRVYENYYQFELPIKYVKPHQVLALNRGEREKVLKVSVEINEQDWRNVIRSQYTPDRRSLFFDALNEASTDSAKRLLLPGIARDIRRSLTETAETHAINLFAKNLRALLTQPPLADQVILAIDPGFRTGSKIAILSPTGKLHETGTIYPHPPQNKKEDAQQSIEEWIVRFGISLIVIGNGTASRETEAFIAGIIKGRSGLHYLITSEAGASVYSASKLAREEFPDLDVSIRGAVSIGRRVQDPLAELVKIDPKSIGVGLYQHDVNQTQLSAALDQVVESVVNAVGVEANTASAILLTHVAGIGSSLAENIISFRAENGPFKTRSSIQDVPGMGPKTFQQAAGFLRIRAGSNPLDATAIHPESYAIARKVIAKMGLYEGLNSADREKIVEIFRKKTDLEAFAVELNTGVLTLEDILNEIAQPGRDPREDLPRPLLRTDVLSMEDLSPGMLLKGTIRNVVDFGAFIDIGVKTDGLLHQSKIPQGTQLQVGDIIEVVVSDVDHDRSRIALAMKESES